ncbi:MAG: beta-carotene 15,15'-dioxygenase, Brp/Blh family [Bacteroidota bacterium]|nr:beta-carotene 15,15'-dioxygenase, Brp/Blh family [Bacteroidota bacterium]
MQAQNHFLNTGFNHTDVIYDYVFIGLGASNSLILLKLLQKGLLESKKVAIFEPDKKNVNDKTYCFWAAPSDPIVNDLKPLITHSYNAIVVNDSPLQNIQNQVYYYIQSIDLYAHTLQIVHNNNFPVFSLKVETLSSKADIQFVHTSEGTLSAHFVFDSRTPSWKNLKKSDIYLNQSFYGIHVRCENEVFQENAFEMMNFNVDQSDYTQFVYTLPFSSRESLIELTRFGSETIQIPYAKEILDKKIKEVYGNYQVIAEEFGCIPMTNCNIPHSEHKGVLNTGARANLIKPSTGYGFKNMFEFASVVSAKIAINKTDHFNKINIESKKRFKFYDTLLLIILQKWPFLGKPIFSKLFKSQSIQTVFAFLDEKTTLLQEIKLFSSLPWPPFLKAVWINLMNKNQLRYLGVFFSVLIYLFIHAFNPTIASYFSYVIILVGLLWIGIPHGAVDHLLYKGKALNSLPLFILKYLAIVVFYFILWQFQPIVSLVLFVLYSAFHFGESELEETGVQVKTIQQYFRAFLKGLSILLVIIGTHYTESIQVISHIQGLQNLDQYHIVYTFQSLFIAISGFLYLCYQRLNAKQTLFSGLLMILFAGIFVPLPLAFAFYFVFQHSYNAWQHLQIGLSVGSVSLYKKAIPYVLGALFIFALILIKAVFVSEINLSFWSYFFIFIACISLPHMIIMHLFYKIYTP